MKRYIPCRFCALLMGILLICSACFTASAEEAGNSGFVIEGTTLLKYNGPGGEVTVPDGIEVLGEWAFDNPGVTKVNLPEGLKEIRNGCFSDCRSLQEITLPASLEKIGESEAFGRNPLLEAINVAEGNPNFVSVDGVLFTADRKKLLYYPCGKNWDGGYAVPEGTEELGYNAMIMNGLKTIELPSTLRRAKLDNPFPNDHALEEIRVAENNPDYSSVDGLLFDHAGTLVCYPAGRKAEILGSADFPEGMKAIGPHAFAGTRYLRNITVPEGIRAVESNCFVGSDALETVILPASVESIAGYAFALCPNLKQVQILNPDAVLDDEQDILLRSPGAALYGYENSTAMEYAAQHGKEFVSLGTAR